MTLRPIVYLLTTMLIFKVTMGHPQSRPLNKKITLEVKNMRLEDLLEKIQHDYNVKMVYGADNFPSDQPITMRADNVSLKHFLYSLCLKAGLTYEVVEEYVIFQYKIPIPVHQDSQRTKVIVVSEKLVSKPEAVVRNDSITTVSIQTTVNQEPVIVIRELPDPDSIITAKDTVKIKEPVYNHKVKKGSKTKSLTTYKILLYLSGDNHLYHFKALPDKNQKYTSELNSAFGISFFKLISRKMLLGVGLLYSHKSFTYHRNFRILNPDDAVSIPDVTSLRLTYYEVPVEVEYQFIHRNKISINLVPGLDAAFLQKNVEHTKYLTHGEPMTSYFSKDTNAVLLGAQAGIKIEYPLLNSFSIFLTPRYVHYLKPVNGVAMHSGYDLFRFQAGIQLNIKNH
jgi:hypothetical protein